MSRTCALRWAGSADKSGVVFDSYRALCEARLRTPYLDRLVLHASDKDRVVYERPSFIHTNEMRFDLDADRLGR